MESQETLVLRKTVEERLDAAGQAARYVARACSAQTPKTGAWAEKLEVMERRIARLGPINLAAIEEHEQQAERKGYLDAQHADLEEALATLDTAMQKTRSRDPDPVPRNLTSGSTTGSGSDVSAPVRVAAAPSLQLTSEDVLGSRRDGDGPPARQAQHEYRICYRAARRRSLRLRWYSRSSS